MKKVLVLLIGLVLVAASCVTERIAGTTDETNTSISGKISYSDGKSASQAAVLIFKDAATTPLANTSADNAGGYKFDSLDPGRYSVWAEGNDSVVAFADSINVPKQQQVIKNLTLEKSGSVTAFIKLQPNHDPRTVTVNALGTQKYGNVDAACSFTIKGLAPGEYTLRLISTLPDYTPTYKTVVIESSVNETLKDSIELIYTGIPVVTGIKATYDTAAGVVLLSWNKTSYRDIQDYLIYRDFFDTVNQSTQAIKIATDTLFHDSLFAGNFFSAADSNSLNSDTSSLHLKYRIAIRNNAGDKGIAYRYADVWVVPPSLLQMRLSFYYDTSSRIIDTFVVYGKYVSPVNSLVKSVQWKDKRTGTVISSKTFAIQKTTEYDTLNYVPKSKGFCTLECTVYDNKNRLWTDTISRYFFSAPLITTQPVSKTIVQGDSAILSVVANGDEPLYYTWYKNSIDTAGILWGKRFVDTIGNKIYVPADSASYYCVVKNPYGSDTSQAAHILVTGNAPIIKREPVNISVPQGTYGVLKVAANGTRPISFSWYKNSIDSVNMVGFHSITFSADSFAIDSLLWHMQYSDTGFYLCVARNQYGSDTSITVHVTITSDTTVIPAAPFSSDQYTIALWHFNEGTGDSVYDASGNANHGRIYGAQWVDGKFGAGLLFSGFDSVVVADKPSLHLQAVTVEAWIYADNFSLAPHSVIVSKEFGNMASYRLQNYDGVGRVSVVTNNNWDNNIVTSDTLSTGAWHYVAGVAANGYLKVYIDGVLAVSAPRTIAMSYDASPLLIGAVRYVANECFRGIVDEVRISSVDRFAF